MNASDFRLNNYVTNKEGGYSQISSISNNCTFKPVPLTDEWLVKFGFEKGGSNRFNYIDLNVDESFYIAVNGEEGVFNCIVALDNGEEEISECISHIKHVHQLQNLYFALTGEELEIKE